MNYRAPQTGQPILDVHRLRKDDKSPLQLISADLLEHYRRCERQLLRLLKAREEREAED